ncbi:MAG: hypothetical protein E6X81_08125 [Clostridium butyricum]|nr:hypothetical protein [Clostridium butyricum]
MSKIFSQKYSNSYGVGQIGWQKNVEKSLGIEGLISSGYIMGYKSVADDLVEECYNTALADTYVFPIVFLYRQYIELLLKNIYFKFNSDEQKEKIIFIRKHGHKLSKVWKKVKELMEENNYKKSDIQFIESFIKEFEKNDPNSFNFRYFVNKDFTATLPNEIYVNLLGLKEAIDKVDDILYSTYG